MVVMVFVVMYMGMDMCRPVGMSVYMGVHSGITVNMSMTFLSGAAEEIAYLMRGKIGNHLFSGLELVGHLGNCVSVHDAFHHFLVDGEGGDHGEEKESAHA